MTAPRLSLGQRLARFIARPRHVHGASSPADLTRLRDSLRPGDALLVEGHSRVSTAVKHLTQSTWSDAALYAGQLPAAAGGQGVAEDERPCFVEADMLDGVRAVAMPQFAGLHARVCRPAGLSSGDVQR